MSIQQRSYPNSAMPHWNNQAFDKHATEIVNAWSATRGQGGASLNALVEKVARDNALNPEQIRRLCRVANSKAFNAAFEQMSKTGGDRVVDFDTAKEDHVIGELHKTAAVAREKTAAEYPALRDELAEARNPVVEDPFPKQAYELGVHERTLNTLLGKDPPKTEQLLHLQKVAEEMRGRRAYAGYRYRAAIEKLGEAQRTIGYDRDKFERDALSVCGPDAVGVINTLRDQIKVAHLEIPAGKVAALLDRLVGEETKLTKLAKQAIDALDEFNTLGAAQSEVDGRLAALRNEVFGGR